MTRDLINVQYPTLEDTISVSAAEITKTTVDASKGVAVKNAFANKNNTLMICVENADDSDSEITFVAGDNYPNAVLGDLTIPVLAETTNIYQIQDASRFENKDGSLNLDFKTGFDGTVFAVAKSTALNS